MSILLAKLLNYHPALPDREEICLRRFVIASRRVIGWLLIQLLLATVIMLPFNETANAGSSFASKAAPTGYGTDNDTDPSPTAWHNWVAVPAHWISSPPIGAWAPAVSVPTDNFTLFGTGTFAPGATAATDPTGAATGGLSVTAQMITGDKWITLGRETVGTAGISNQQISSAMEKFPKNAAYVFAQYSPDSATGRIVIQKVEKMPDGQIKVYQADFTPWSGELWKAQGKYRSAQEISNGDAGYNPFAIFEGAQTDPLFHNLSWEAMKVAVGHAMRRYGATFAFVARAQTNPPQQYTSTDNSLFSTTATTTVNAYAQPLWYVATPMEGTPSGETGQICVIGGPTTTSSCDDPAHVAIAGVMFSPWSGGNMPQNQDLMYSYTDSQSSWNVLFFAVIITIVTAGVASFLDPVVLAAAGGAGAITGSAAATYAIASTVFGSGGSLLQSQQGFFGATGNGWEQQMVATGSPVAQQIQNGTMNSVNSNFVAVPMGTGGMTGTDTLYNGNCPAGFTVQQCLGANPPLDPGTKWHPNSYAEYNSTKAMRLRYQSCLAAGYTAVQAEQCAAPAVKTMQY